LDSLDLLPIASIRVALRAFRHLLSAGEITERDPELLNSVLADARVAEVLAVLEEEFDVKVLRGRNRVDLSPDPGNRELGYRYSDLRGRFGDRVDSAYLAILGMLALCFRSGNFRVPDFDFLELFDLEEYLTRKAEAVAGLGSAVARAEAHVGTRLFEPCREWLDREKFKEGPGLRSTRYGILKSVFGFLEEQGLVHREPATGENERVYPTEKLKAQAEALTLDDRYAAMVEILGRGEEALAPWVGEEGGETAEPPPQAEKRKRRRGKAKTSRIQELKLF
jgi:hypothetical protein